MKINVYSHRLYKNRSKGQYLISILYERYFCLINVYVTIDTVLRIDQCFFYFNKIHKYSIHLHEFVNYKTCIQLGNGHLILRKRGKGGGYVGFFI